MFPLINLKKLSLLFLTSTAVMAASNTTTTTIAPFNVSSPPGTDIWRKPPTHNAFNASTYPEALPQHPIERFQRARVTFALPPGDQLRQYDQAGLLLHLTKPGMPNNETKWVKTGIEWYYGKPYISTVGCDIWADWSVVPMPSYAGNATRPTATIEAQRERDALGKSLWVYWVVRDEDGKEVERQPLREVTWFFAEDEGWEVGIGGYVCRPTEAGGDEDLKAEFAEGVEVETLNA